MPEDNNPQNSNFAKSIKKNFYGKPNAIKIFFPAGFSEVVLQEINSILNNLILPKKFIPTIQRFDNYYLIENIHFSAIMEFVLRNHCFTDIHLIIIRNKTASGISAFKKRCEEINWNFYLTKAMAIKIKINSVASHAFHENKLKEVVADIISSYTNITTEITHDNETTLLGELYKDKLTLSISLSGILFYKRNYRQILSKSAPLREDIAASCIQHVFNFANQSNFYPKINTLCVPFVGTGTFILEYLLIALNIAPGLLRDFVLIQFPLFRAEMFAFLIKKLTEKIQQTSLDIIAYDTSQDAVHNATANYANLTEKLKQLNFDLNQIDFNIALDDFFNMAFSSDGNLFLPLNPPYGLRLHTDNAVDFYKRIAIKINNINDTLKNEGPRLLGFVLCPSENTWSAFIKTLKLPHTRTYHFNQGGLDIRVCEFLN